MDMHSREQYIERVREEYRKADKKGKTRLLNEARKRTRLNRKVLIGKLAHAPVPRSRRRRFTSRGPNPNSRRLRSTPRSKPGIGPRLDWRTRTGTRHGCCTTFGRISGHKTRSGFDRHAIFGEPDLEQAARKGGKAHRETRRSRGPAPSGHARGCEIRESGRDCF